MYTEDSEKYFKFAYSYKTVNHTERYHCSKPFSSNGFLYFIGSIKPIAYQPKSCSYIPYGYSQLIDFFSFKIRPQTHQKREVWQNELIRFHFFLGKEVGVKGGSCTKVLESWQSFLPCSRKQLAKMHLDASYPYWHYYTLDYILQITKNIKWVHWENSLGSRKIRLLQQQCSYIVPVS